MSAKSVVPWLRRTDWLWMVIGGFYLLAYLFWYIPALAALPNSLRDPPSTFPWHWPLDFAATGFAGGCWSTWGSTGHPRGVGGETERRERQEPSVARPKPTAGDSPG